MDLSALLTHDVAVYLILASNLLTLFRRRAERPPVSPLAVTVLALIATCAKDAEPRAARAERDLQLLLKHGGKRRKKKRNKQRQRKR